MVSYYLWYYFYDNIGKYINLLSKTQVLRQKIFNLLKIMKKNREFRRNKKNAPAGADAFFKVNG